MESVNDVGVLARQRFQSLKRVIAIPAWAVWLIWAWKRLGDAYDAVETIRLVNPFMNSIVPFIQNWGWLLVWCV